MSPAFINRFDVIVFENQLEDLNNDELKNFIKFLLDNYKYINTLYCEESEENTINEEDLKKIQNFENENDDEL